MATDPATESNGAHPSDWKRLLLLLLFVAALRTFTVANATMPSRDCVVFVRDGLQLENPPPNQTRVDVIMAAEHPPGYPAAIIAMSWIVRPLMGVDQPTVDSMALSAQLVSALSAVLLVIPLFLIARRVFDRNVAFMAVAIFEVLPVFVEVSSDGISDSVYLLTSAWALWFAFRAIDATCTRVAFLWGIGSGVFCGIGYLIRPDALVVALAIGLTCAGLVVSRIRSGNWRAPFCAGLGLTIATFGVMAPYCVTIGGLTNKPTGRGISESIQGEQNKPTFFRRESSIRPGVNVPIAAWWDPEENKGQSKPLWAAKSLGSEFLKAAHYSVPFFALIGVFIHRRRFCDPKLIVLLTVIAIHSSLLWYMAWNFDYVSQRHTLLSVMLATLFAASSFPRIGLRLVRRSPFPSLRLWPEWKAAGLLAILVIASALPRDFRSLHSERVGHKAAGRWLAENASPEVTIIDPFGWAEWYAGRTLRTPSPPSYKLDRDYYLVFEPNAKSPHSRLNHYDLIRGVYRNCEMIYQYPVDASPDKIRVAVYYYRHVPSKK